jgi:sulfite exporter TauE/SafE
MTALVAASDKPFAFHARFHAGRLLGFVALGALLGLLGRSIAFSSSLSGFLVLVVAVVMIIFGLKMVGAIPARLLSFKAPRFVSRLTDAPTALGVATFFLPCGFMQSMQLYAASTGSPSQAALVMFLFALGSMPPLLGIGMAAQAGRKRSKRFNAAAGVLVATIGLLNGQNGLTLLGVSSPASPSSSSSSSSIVNGSQLIQMEVTNIGTYEPSTFTVKAGTPVRWEVERGNNVGCGSTLVFEEAGIRTELKAGENELAFTPKRPGRYPFTCSMGMFRGTMIVEPKS